MDDVKKWVRNNRKIFVASVLAGFILTPLLWPFFLGIIYNTLSLAGPVFLILAGLKMPWAAFQAQRQETGGAGDAGTKQNGREADMDIETADNNNRKGAGDFEQEETAGQTTRRADGAEADVSGHPESTSGGERGREKADTFWNEDGEGRIIGLLGKALKEGGYGISVTPDGMCYKITPDGTARIGALKGYPGSHAAVVERLKTAGYAIKCSVKGKYLHIFPGRGKHAGVSL
ncbi:MAG: hypothetical protein LUF27_05035 [Lachnospiraceae bacterium]|nr:hypothetical protein [Lachnospiraceae bacterium]